MAGQTSVEIDPKEMKRAQETWAGFTTLVKWSVIVCAAVLALLGLAFIDW